MRIYGMKYSWKGHTVRNIHKNIIKRRWQDQLVYVKDINRNIPTTWRRARSRKGSFISGRNKSVSYLVFWAQSTTKNYIRAKNNVQSFFYLHCTQVIKQQIIPKLQIQSWHKFAENIHKHQTKNFRKICPFGIAPVKKAHKARTRWYRGPFRRFINTRFFF